MICQLEGRESDNKEFGRRGEELAAKRLKSLGYRILERNYRTPAGEIDIVAMEGGSLVFVEVKSRRDMSFGPPELAVNFHKRRQIERAALLYLTSKGKADTPCRFDVVGISAGPGDKAEVHVIKDAFETSGGR
jgi:putative endonuclease